MNIGKSLAITMAIATAFAMGCAKEPEGFANPLDDVDNFVGFGSTVTPSGQRVLRTRDSSPVSGYGGVNYQRESHPYPNDRGMHHRYYRGY